MYPVGINYRNPLSSKSVQPTKPNYGPSTESTFDPSTCIGDHEEFCPSDSNISVEDETEPAISVHSSTINLKGAKVFKRCSSFMLNEGDHHEVWKPGQKLSQQNGSSEAIAARRLTLFNSIKSYHTPDDDMDISEMKRNGKQSYASPTKEMLERRRKQWEQIELDTLSLDDHEVGRNSVKVKRVLKYSLTDSSLPITPKEEFESAISRCLSMSPIKEEYSQDCLHNSANSDVSFDKREDCEHTESIGNATFRKKFSNISPIEEEHNFSFKESESKSAVQLETESSGNSEIEDHNDPPDTEV